MFQNITEKVGSFVTVIALAVSTVFPNIPFLKNNPDVVLKQAISNFDTAKSVHIEYEILSQYQLTNEQKGQSDLDLENNKEKSSYTYSDSYSLGSFGTMSVDWVDIGQQSYFFRSSVLNNKWINWNRGETEKPIFLPPGFFSIEIYTSLKELLSTPEDIEKVNTDDDSVLEFRFQADSEKVLQNFKDKGIPGTGLERKAPDPSGPFFVTIDRSTRQIIRIEQSVDTIKLTLNLSNFNKPVSITEPESEESLTFRDELDPSCPKPFDESNKYSTSEAAEYLGSLLKTGLRNSYNKFKCESPQSTTIPQKARDVYELSNNWNPKKWPDDYIECIAFVFMSFNMSGNPIVKETGNAISFAGKKYLGGMLVNDDTYKEQFAIFESGKTKELPKVGDLVIWKDYAPYGHIGVVTKVSTDLQRIRVSSSNSYKVYVEYEYLVDKDGYVTIDPNKVWKPSYWARKKN